MGFEKKDVFKIENIEYVVLETLVYDGVTYGFVNEIKDDADIETYHIIYMKDGKLKFLNNFEITNILIPLFQEKILSDLKENNLLGE